MYMMNEKHYEVDSKSADTVTLMNEQINDPSLSKYFDMVRRGNKQFLFVMVYCIDAVKSTETKLNSYVCRRKELKLF
jgi:hypothetical protein